MSRPEQQEEGTMARDFARSFYNSNVWKETRAAFKKSKGGLCERCLKKGLIRPADIVHHRTPLTPENINDPKISLAWSNLEALCFDCHEEEHSGRTARYRISPDGRVEAK